MPETNRVRNEWRSPTGGYTLSLPEVQYRVGAADYEVEAIECERGPGVTHASRRCPRIRRSRPTRPCGGLSTRNRSLVGTLGIRSNLEMSPCWSDHSGVLSSKERKGRKPEGPAYVGVGAPAPPGRPRASPPGRETPWRTRTQRSDATRRRSSP